MSYPDVIIPVAYIGQTAYESTDIKILQVSDDVVARTVKAFCQLGDNPSFKYWVEVMNNETYNPDWSNDTVNAAVLAYFVNPV